MAISPRAQVRELRKELDQMWARQQADRRQMEQEQQRQTEALRQRYDELLRRQEGALNAVYQQKLLEYRQEQQRLADAQFAQLEAYDRRILEEQQRELKRLAQMNAQLRREVDRAIHTDAAKQRAAKEEAERCCVEAQQADKRIRGLPHAFFARDQYPVLANQLAVALRLKEQGMYEASAGCAVAAAASLDALAAQVCSEREIWRQLFARYAECVRQLLQIRDGFCAMRLTSPYPRNLNDADRAYWSSGLYPEVNRRLEESRRMLEQAADADEFLKNGRAPAKHALLESIESCRKTDGQLLAAIASTVQEASLSDERYFLAQTLMPLAEERGYEVLSCGFVRENAIEQPLGTYELTLGFADMRLTVRFIPHREHGIAHHNDCHISIAYQEDEAFSGTQQVKALWQNVIANVHQFYQEGGQLTGALGFVEGANPPAPQPPDPTQYVQQIGRRIARKGNLDQI